jgi:hypothetical protein
MRMGTVKGEDFAKSRLYDKCVSFGNTISSTIDSTKPNPLSVLQTKGDCETRDGAGLAFLALDTWISGLGASDGLSHHGLLQRPVIISHYLRILFTKWFQQSKFRNRALVDSGVPREQGVATRRHGENRGRFPVHEDAHLNPLQRGERVRSAQRMEVQEFKSWTVHASQLCLSRGAIDPCLFCLLPVSGYECP